MKTTIEEVKNFVNSLGYELLDAYLEVLREGTSKRCMVVTIKDEKGYKYKIFLSSLKQKHGALSRFVHNANPFSLENIALWLHLNGKPFGLCDDNVYDGKGKALKFNCLTCGETFIAKWAMIYSGKQRCLYCAGRKAGRYNNLACLRPDLMKEWDNKKNRAIGLSAKKVTPRSFKKAWWKCARDGHSWEAQIYSRAIAKKGCPICAARKSESFITRYLKRYCEETYAAITEYKEFRNPMTGYWLPYDIYIPNGIFIEIQGEQHYSPTIFNKTEGDFEYRQYLDRLKKEYAESRGVYVEVDLRAIKKPQQAIDYIEQFIPR